MNPELERLAYLRETGQVEEAKEYEQYLRETGQMSGGGGNVMAHTPRSLAKAVGTQSLAMAGGVGQGAMDVAELGSRFLNSIDEDRAPGFVQKYAPGLAKLYANGRGRSNAPEKFRAAGERIASALRPEDEAQAYDSGQMGARVGTNFLPYLALGTVGKAGSALAGTFGLTQDIGSLPEESVNEMVAKAADWSRTSQSATGRTLDKILPESTAPKMREWAQTPTGRGFAGTLVGAIPEALFAPLDLLGRNKRGPVPTVESRAPETRQSHLLPERTGEQTGAYHGQAPPSVEDQLRTRFEQSGDAEDVLRKEMAKHPTDDARARFEAGGDAEAVLRGAGARPFNNPETRNSALAGMLGAGAGEEDESLEDRLRNASLMAGGVALSQRKTGKPSLDVLDAIRPRFANTKFGQTLYSRLGAAIASAPFEKGDAGQWLAVMSRNVPEKELERSHLRTLMTKPENANRTLTKGEVLDGWRQTAFTVEPKVLQDMHPDERRMRARLEHLREEEGRIFDDIGATMDTASGDRKLTAIHQEMDEIHGALKREFPVDGADSENTVMFANHALRDGDPGTYQEHLLQARQGGQVGKNLYGNEFLGYHHWVGKRGGGIRQYPITDLVASVRRDIKTLPDGRKAYRAQEFQSDWKQEVQKKMTPEQMEAAEKEFEYASLVSENDAFDLLHAKGELADALGVPKLGSHLDDLRTSTRPRSDTPAWWHTLEVEPPPPGWFNGDDDMPRSWLDWLLSQHPLTRAEYAKATKTAEAVERLRNKIREAKGVARLPEGSHHRTKDWTELAFKYALFDAVQNNADVILLPTGKMAQWLSGAPLKGATQFYESGVPSTVKSYLRSAGIDADIRPHLDGDPLTPMLELRVTPEMRELAKSQRLWAGGAGVAAMPDEDENGKPLSGAEKAAIAVAILGGGAAGLRALGRAGARGAARAAGSLLSDGTTPRPASAYERAMASGSIGERNTEPLFNKSVGLNDPDPSRTVQEVRDQLLATGIQRRRLTDREATQLAKDVDIDELDLATVSVLDNTQVLAVADVYKSQRTVSENLFDKLAKTTSPEEAVRLHEQLETSLQRQVTLAGTLQRAGSEAGRTLRAYSKLGTRLGTAEGALAAARSYLGVPILSPSAEKKILDVFMDTSLHTEREREMALAIAIRKLGKHGFWAVASDVRRGIGMLSSPVTWAVNVTGNAVEGAYQNLAVRPIAAGLDAAYSLATGADRSISTRGRGSGFLKGAKQGVKYVKKHRKQMMKGIDPENPSEALYRNKVDYVSSLNLEPKEADAAWLKHLRETGRKGAATLQAGSDAVYFFMSAADRPFFEAAQQSSLMERAMLRAQREGLKPATDEFVQRVTFLMDKDNINPLDAAMALADAMNDTFKTRTVVREIVGKLGTLGELLVPYANTPTNLVRKGLENTPGVGLVLNHFQVEKLRKTLTAMDISPADVNREVRRARAEGFSKFLATGTGLVAAGYAMAEAGVLTGEYTSPMGRTRDEREDTGLQNTTGQGPLTIKVGGHALSLAWAAQYAPALALGFALSREAKEQGDLTVGGTAARFGRSAAHTVTEFPLFQGAKTVVDLAETKDFGRAAGRTAASFIPAGSFLSMIARGMDPIGPREAEGFGETIKERLPFLREQVAPKVGPLGEVTPAPHFLNTALNPFRPTRVREGPLYDALLETKTYPSAAPRMRAETDEQYARRMRPRDDGEGILDYRARISRPRRTEDETAQAYSRRRQREGVAERDLLTRLVEGDNSAWRFVSPQAKQRFRENKDWRALLSAALTKQRSSVTRERNAQLTLPQEP